MMMASSKRRTVLVVLIGLVIMISGLLLLAWWRDIALERKLVVECECIGKTILLYIHDHSEAPQGISDLVDGGYLAEVAPGEFRVGPAARGRSTDFSLPPSKIVLEFTAKMRIGTPDAGAASRPVLSVDGNPGAKTMAEKYSARARMMLAKPSKESPAKEGVVDHGP